MLKRKRMRAGPGSIYPRKPNGIERHMAANRALNPRIRLFIRGETPSLIRDSETLISPDGIRHPSMLFPTGIAPSGLATWWETAGNGLLLHSLRSPASSLFRFTGDNRPIFSMGNL